MRLALVLASVLGCGSPGAADGGPLDGGGAIDAPAIPDSGVDAPDEEEDASTDAPSDALVPSDGGPPDAPTDALPDTCGDSVVQPHEACDVGDRVGGDGCRADCLGEEECGDGFVDVGEICLPAAPTSTTLLDGRVVGTLALADAEGDGDLDLYAIDSATPRPLQLFVNDGGGVVAAPVDTSTTFVPVAFADFDGDGLDDLLTYEGAHLRVVVNEGAGRFSTAPRSTPSDGGALAAGDLDGDGSADAVLVSFDGHVHVFLSDGTGTLVARPDVVVGAELVGVQLADVNGDADLDVIAVHDTGIANASILLGRGDGTFDPVRTHDVSFPRGRFGVADVTGEGRLDLVVVNQILPAGIDVSPGNGDGTFAMHRVLRTTSFVFLQQVIDADTDGDADVVYAGAMDPLALGGVSADGTTLSTTATLPAIGFSALADMNGDGAVDLVGVVSPPEGAAIAILLADP